jgi:alpha-1,3-mannosyltransferase
MLPLDAVRPAQYVFLGVYLVTLGLVAWIYYLAGSLLKDKTSVNVQRGMSVGSRPLPQALLIPLVLSKRAHSIYLLRLFNDPIAMVLFYASVVVLIVASRRSAQSRLWIYGVGLYR